MHRQTWPRRSLAAAAAAALAAAPMACVPRASAQDSGSTAPPWETPGAAPAPASQPGASQPGLGPSAVPPGMVPAQNLELAPPGRAAAAGSGPARPGAAADDQPLGLMQKAWERPEAHMGPGQTRPGLKPVRWSPGSTYQVVTRQGLVTTIGFPEDEQLTGDLVSDPQSYEARISGDRRSIAIRPLVVGVDANLVLYGQGGNVYTFYLTSASWDYPTITDINVEVTVPGMSRTAGTTAQGASEAGPSDAGAYDAGPAAGGRASPYGKGEPSNRKFETAAYDEDPSARLTMRPRADATRPGQDYAAVGLTGNGRIRADLRILVPDKDSAAIAPVAAWRDDRFTYLDFGPRAASMNQWPVASLVVDQSESPVGTRVSGPNRSIMVVEAVGNVTLREGSHIVCIKMLTVGPDQRAPVYDEPYRNSRGPLSVPTDVTKPTDPPPGVTGPGYGDYQGEFGPKPTGVRKWLGLPAAAAGAPAYAPIAGTPAAVGYRIVTGPFDEPTATTLAAQLGRGYHGSPPAGAAPELEPPATAATDQRFVSGPPAEVTASTASPAAAAALCAKLRQYDHPCRTY